jgi:hypothetical protein
MEHLPPPLPLSHRNANRTVHISVFTFFKAFSASRTKREKWNAPVGTAIYNSNR